MTFQNFPIAVVIATLGLAVVVGCVDSDGGGGFHPRAHLCEVELAVGQFEMRDIKVEHNEPRNCPVYVANINLAWIDVAAAVTDVAPYDVNWADVIITNDDGYFVGSRTFGFYEISPDTFYSAPSISYRANTGGNRWDKISYQLYAFDGISNYHEANVRVDVVQGGSADQVPRGETL